MLITAVDDGGVLKYKYGSHGKMIETKLLPVITNSMTYDDRGMQKTLTEANSGTTEYNFSAYGELVSQKDAINNITTIEYNDPLGRMTIKRCTTAITGAVTNYTYNYVNSGNGLNMLQSIFMSPVPNNNLYTYTYDNLNRVTKEDKIINNGTVSQHFVTNYAYDPFSNLQKETYPGGFAVKHTYNENGYHTQINRDDNNDVIWRLDEMNALGQYTKYTSHPQNSPVQTIKMYDNFGFSSSITASGVQNLHFTFDPASGNLMDRTDGMHTLTESFTYDESSRLKTSTSEGLSVNYFSNGNIQDKSDAGAGTYQYDPIRKNAAVQLPSPGANISQATQNISYTSFNKTEKITEDAADAFDLRFAYGPYDERVTTEMRVNGNITERRYYNGNYEKTIDVQSGSVLSEINYISCAGGLAAMFVKDATNPNGKMYYPYKDHLGSIVTVVNETGTEKYEQSFDAWGRKRNPTDWSYNNIPSVPAWLYRGYTGHEHLPQFALINMNGRMYDPVMGRMLSPDNFIQAAGFSQSFNRYSYSANNPLKYTDPSGDFLGTIFTAVWDFGTTIFTKGAIDPWNTGSNRREAWKEFDPTAKWSKTNKAWKVDIGLFKTDPDRTFAGRAWELTSRFTWQLPQTFLGYAYTHGRNIAGRVESVEYFHGTTIAVKNPGQGKYARSSVTLGNYITLANVEDDKYANIEISEKGYTTMHEYGHYLQSQKSGPLFLFKYGVPSAFGDADWTEWDANQRAANYFYRTNIFNWQSISNDRYRYLPGYVTNPRWFEYPLFFLGGPVGQALIIAKNWNQPW